MFYFRTQCFQNNTLEKCCTKLHTIVQMLKWARLNTGVLKWECSFINHFIPLCRRSVHSPLVIVATLVGWITSVLVQTRRAKVRGRRDPIIGCSDYKVSSHIKTNMPCLKSTIFNIIRWVAGTNDSSTKCLMFQVLFFFHNFLQNSLQKSFQFIFLFFYKFTKTKIKSFECPKSIRN